MLILAQSTAGQNAAAGGVFAVFAGFWCFAMALGIGQFVIFLIALIQILQRNMPATDKLLWCAISWFVPIIGPILWWTIGSKQYPPGGPPARL